MQSLRIDIVVKTANKDSSFLPGLVRHRDLAQLVLIVGLQEFQDRELSRCSWVSRVLSEVLAGSQNFEGLLQGCCQISSNINISLSR